MKRISVLLTALLLFLSLTSCGSSPGNDSGDMEDSENSAAAAFASGQEESAVAEGASDVRVMDNPMDLFSKQFNLFYDVDFPEGYKTYEVSYESGEFHLYRLYLTAEASAEEVTEFFSNLVGDSAEESIQQNLEYLNAGSVQIQGTQVEGGLSADIMIEPTKELVTTEEDAVGYAITMTGTPVESEFSKYDIALDQNFSIAALGDAWTILKDTDPLERELKVMKDTGLVQAMCRYAPGDGYEVLKTALLDGLSQYRQDNMLSWKYGDMSISIHFFDETKEIYLLENHRDTMVNLADYQPSITLSSLGLESYGDSWGYKDNEAGVFLKIERTDWGAEANKITFGTKEYGGYYVEIDMPEQVYHVIMNEGAISYSYDAFADKLLADDLDAVRAAYAELTGDDSDLALKKPISTVDNYTYIEFGYKPEHLFNLQP
jgi:hypothetical protein